MTDWRKLFEETAEAITKRHVLFRFRQPPIREADGECYRSDDTPSVVFIDINPILSLKKQYEILLHELGHVLAGHINIIKPYNPKQEQSASQTILSEEWSKSDPWETTAQAKADELENWATEKISNHIRPDYPDELIVNLKLTALRFWKGK